MFRTSDRWQGLSRLICAYPLTRIRELDCGCCMRRTELIEAVKVVLGYVPQNVFNPEWVASIPTASPQRALFSFSRRHPPSRCFDAASPAQVFAHGHHCVGQRWAECYNRVAVGRAELPRRPGWSAAVATPSRSTFNCIGPSNHCASCRFPPAATGPADTVALRYCPLLKLSLITPARSVSSLSLLPM
jgi:hypothetical protein